MTKQDRPCIKVCLYDEESGWCLGCGMTRLEKKAWKHVPAYRTVIGDSLPARVEALAGEGYRTGPDADGKKRKG
ncbi:MAG: putative Fe-S protein [Rubritepida sp.]|nr:putative Fe-S protein [Rubritepida sp.]